MVDRKIAAPPFCKLCNRASRLTTGQEIFPKYAKLPLGKRPFYICDGCTGYCNTVAKSKKPAGIIATDEIRRAQMILKARAFDPLWENAHRQEQYDGSNAMDMKGKKMVQNAARRRIGWWLADQLGLKREEAVIAFFDLEMCRKAWTLLKGIDYPTIRLHCKMLENSEGFNEAKAGEKIA